MPVVSSCFAISIILVISLSFFQTRYFLTKASRYYAVCLALNLASALADISQYLVGHFLNAPMWVVHTLSALEYLLPPLTATILVLYLINKVVEHVNEESDLYIPIVALIATYCIFLTLVFVNIGTGILFEVTPEGDIIKGVAHFSNYVAVTMQAIVALAFCLKHNHTLSRSIVRAGWQSVCILTFCITMSTIFTNMNCLVVTCALVEIIFFLNFQNQRIGVHSLTKLNDRRRYFLEIENRIKLGQKFKTYVIRLENIKTVSVTYGYGVGDEAVYLFAFSIERLFSNSISFHLHGHTFALVMPYNEKEHAEESEKLRTLLNEKVRYNNIEIKLETTTVEYICPENVLPDPAFFYEKLEYAIEQASEKKISYSKYTADIGDEMLRRKYITNRLRKIDRENGYEVYLQPIYNVKTQKFSSMEALLRLHEPDGSMISPAEFIPIAEKTGYISAITWFVINEVCNALSNIRAFDGVRASINLPMKMLLSDKFHSRLNKIVDGYRIEHGRIAFEFTERVIIEDLDTAVENMNELSDDGYTFLLDDFGVGYSNFNCIIRLPIRTVKLDSSLTSREETLNGKYNLVDILTDLFHDMGLRVIAEGAETEEYISMLRDCSVDYIQGYYFAKPMSIKRTAAFLSRKGKIDIT